MPSRNIIQDSDDEDDGDARLSPTVHSPHANAVLKPPSDSMEFVDFGSSSPAQGGSSGRLERSTETGSAEALSQAIHKAHHDLAEPSTDEQFGALHSEGATWALTSPVVEKVKRRKTTMEEFGSTTSSSIGKGKTVKTYGIQRSRDDIDARWSEGWPRTNVDHEDSNTVLIQPRMEKKKRNATDLDRDANIIDMKRLVRKASTREINHGLEPWQEPMQSSMIILDDPSQGGFKPSIVSSAQLDGLTLPSMASPMLQPLGRSENKQELGLERSISSTIPNTSVESAQSQKVASARLTSSSARMTTPTISEKSPGENLTQTTDQINGALEYLGEAPLAVHDARAGQQLALDRDNAHSVPKNICTQQSTTEAQDELSMPTPNDKNIQSSRPKKRSKRRLSQVEVSDAHESDEAVIGLPVEHYQPRPSRSRANRTVDDLVLAIDYSKRPEAVVKARNKRRKTDGDHIIREEKPMVDNFASRPITPEGTNEREVLSPPEGTRSEFAMVVPKETVVDVPPVMDDDETLVFETDDIPKKKRGRPKKQTGTDGDIQVEEKVSGDGFDTKTSTELLTFTVTAAPAPAKKPRKKKKAAEVTGMLSEEMVVEEDELALASKLHASVDAAENDPSAVLDANSNLHNIMKPAPKVTETTRLLVKEATPVSAVPSQPPETPTKSTAQGPGKHSPLNTGKVPYRVGLSKRARIEPLLRIVRK